MIALILISFYAVIRTPIISVPYAPYPIRQTFASVMTPGKYRECDYCEDKHFCRGVNPVADALRKRSQYYRSSPPVLPPVLEYRMKPPPAKPHKKRHRYKKS